MRVENIEIAHAMALLEDAIQAERDTHVAYLEFCNGKENDIYKRMVRRWSSMIDAFETAFNCDYFKRY